MLAGAPTYISEDREHALSRVRGFPAIRTYPVVERHGFIWVILTPGLPIDVAAHRVDRDPHGSDLVALMAEPKVPPDLSRRRSSGGRGTSRSWRKRCGAVGKPRSSDRANAPPARCGGLCR